MTALDEPGAALPPHPPQRRLPANEWLPPLEFLPPEWLPVTASPWVPWMAPPRPPPRPRDSQAGSPQQSLDALAATRDADLVYDSMDKLDAAFHAHLATLIEVPEFRAWQQSNPSSRAYRGCCGRLKARDALQYGSTPVRRTASPAPTWPRLSTSRHPANRGRDQSLRRPMEGHGTLLRPCRSF